MNSDFLKIEQTSNSDSRLPRCAWFWRNQIRKSATVPEPWPSWGMWDLVWGGVGWREIREQEPFHTLICEQALSAWGGWPHREEPGTGRPCSKPGLSTWVRRNGRLRLCRRRFLVQILVSLGCQGHRPSIPQSRSCPGPCPALPTAASALSQGDGLIMGLQTPDKGGPQGSPWVLDETPGEKAQLQGLELATQPCRGRGTSYSCSYSVGTWPLPVDWCEQSYCEELHKNRKETKDFGQRA